MLHKKQIHAADAPEISLQRVCELLSDFQFQTEHSNIPIFDTNDEAKI